MANYSLVVNSKFRPYSFDELVKPYAIYGQAYDEQQNQLSDLAVKSNVWKGLANQQTDPTAYQMYKTYADDLESKADMLAKEGLTPASRKGMLDLKSRYSSEITPLENAWKARDEQRKLQEQLTAQDPTLLLSRQASTTSLDDYIRNPQLSYKSYSGKLITAQAASAASALAKEMQEEPRKWRSILGNSYYETMMQKGFSSKAVLQAIQDNPNAAPQLTKIAEDAISSSGVRNWGDQDTIARAVDYAKQGLWSAVGETQYQNLDNWRAKMAAQEDMQKRAEKRAAARQSPPSDPKGFALNPSNIYSSRKSTEEEHKYKNAIKNYSQYFYKDSHGQMRMTYAGWKEYNRKNKGTIAGKVMTTPEGTTIRVADTHNGETSSAFRQFMDNLGAYKVTKGKWQPGNLGNVWGKYAEDSPAARTAKYDATKTSEYIYDVDQSPEYQRNYKAKISRVIGSDEQFKEVDYNPKTNQWEHTGNTLSFADFDTDDYTLVSRAPSEVGNTLFIKKKGEKARRYETLPGINSTVEGARDEVIAQKLSTQKMLQNSKLSPTKRVKLENYYDNLNQQQIMFESQIDVVNSTKKQEISPYYIP